MAKKNEEKVLKEPAVIPPSPPAPLPQGEGSVGYTVGRWGWHDQYVCKHCQFDTLDLKIMDEHLMLVHGQFKLEEPAPPPTPPQIQQPNLERGDDEVADGIFEINLKENEDGTTNVD